MSNFKTSIYYLSELPEGHVKYFNLQENTDEPLLFESKLIKRE